MKKLRIHNPSGEVNVVSSKSELHRLLFISVLSNRNITIKNVYFSDDIKRTIDVLIKCGANITTYSNYVVIKPSTLAVNDILDCGESGTTLRFIIPFVLSKGLTATIVGHNKLVERPIDEYFNIFDKCNIKYEYNNKLPLKVEGILDSGIYEISGTRSSQFISALLIALAFKEEESKLIIKDELQSKSYVDMTIEILKIFNISIEVNDNIYHILPYKGSNVSIVEASIDYSQATFYLVMNALGADISINNINKSSIQGDYKIIEFLEQSGVVFDSHYKVIKNDYKPLDIDLSDNPDLAMALSLYASFLNGKSYLRGLRRLKYKESDRFKAICDMFDNLGVIYNSIGDHTLEIVGPSVLKDAYIDVKNDHRILFTASIASMFVDIYVDDLKPQNKSYPTYFNEYIKLGGQILDE